MSKTKTIDLTSVPDSKDTLAELAPPIAVSSLLGTAFTILRTCMDRHAGFQSRCRGGRWGECTSGFAMYFVALPRMGGQVNVAQACDAGETMNRQGDMPLLPATYIFTGNFYLPQYVSCLFIRCSAFFNLGDAETYTAAKLYTLITCGLILFSFLNLTLTDSTAQEIPRHRLVANLLVWLVI